MLNAFDYSFTITFDVVFVFNKKYLVKKVTYAVRHKKQTNFFCRNFYNM